MRWDARGCETVLNATMLAVGDEASRSGAEVLLVAVPLGRNMMMEKSVGHTQDTQPTHRRQTPLQTVRATFLPLTTYTSTSCSCDIEYCTLALYIKNDHAKCGDARCDGRERYDSYIA